MEAMMIYRVETEWGSVSWYCEAETAIRSVTVERGYPGWVKAYEEEVGTGKSRMIAASAEVK